jgi:hypothetical protein
MKIMLILRSSGRIRLLKLLILIGGVIWDVESEYPWLELAFLFLLRSNWKLIRVDIDMTVHL